MKYILEASKDGFKWVHHGTFIKGKMSRFYEPFDETIAIREAEHFKEFWSKDGWKFVRIIINV